jgi:hypothetical protein
MTTIQFSLSGSLRGDVPLEPRRRRKSRPAGTGA